LIYDLIARITPSNYSGPFDYCSCAPFALSLLLGLFVTSAGAASSDDALVLAGEKLFNGEAGCVACHAYRGRGGNIGPALDGVSEDIPPRGLVNALLNPSGRITEGYETKQIELNDGTIIRGRLRNESELTVQLLSGDGEAWVTYAKDQLKSVIDVDESLMPPVYGTLPTEQQEQLIAFLNSL
jgi:quinoprotein glucose dehydrogenase